MENLLSLERAAKSIITNSSQKPSPNDLVNALLQAEKTAKRDKKRYSFLQLIGTWRLCFITGTQKTRQRAGIVLKSGRYLPSWVKIYLSYSPVGDGDSPEARGNIQNLVELGSLQFSFSGPVKFLSGKNILAFDFTRIIVKLFGFKLYEGYIRGGKTSEEKFYAERVGKQAFFAYFLVQENLIAARGRGGGLAFWGKDKTNDMERRRER
ncbi:hypothetical protein NIES593_14355 [Hydrococcus rivularis NIES-593]|uniref:Plastid lipid-associated protein/fibrillin conserved domain-containing protein n=1 Tax=Hydrococcus rivularis NIES-593 TaxID=1921803 RepID=A0A1U7HE83_9CYAN|nr:hypothetical protein [Hydrococcus rivularis]OKH21851.1 hypothetical protein NIES593_14355 [Hydrococcus rivularis NIES-593]